MVFCKHHQSHFTVYFDLCCCLNTLCDVGGKAGYWWLITVSNQEDKTPGNVNTNSWIRIEDEWKLIAATLLTDCLALLLLDPAFKGRDLKNNLYQPACWKSHFLHSLYAEYAVYVGHQLPGGHHSSCSKRKTFHSMLLLQLTYTCT